MAIIIFWNLHVLPKHFTKDSIFRMTAFINIFSLYINIQANAKWKISYEGHGVASIATKFAFTLGRHLHMYVNRRKLEKSNRNRPRKLQTAMHTQTDAHTKDTKIITKCGKIKLEVKCGAHYRSKEPHLVHTHVPCATETVSKVLRRQNSLTRRALAPPGQLIDGGSITYRTALLPPADSTPKRWRRLPRVYMHANTSVVRCACRLSSSWLPAAGSIAT